MKKLLILLLFPILAIGQPNLEAVDSLFQKKQFNKAENIILEYLNDNPNNHQALELLGDVYANQKQWDNAIKPYKILVKENQNKADYHYKYASALSMKALQNRLKAIGFIRIVKKHFLKAAELDEKHINTRWALVKLYTHVPKILGGSISKALLFSNELKNLSKVDGHLAKGYIYKHDKQYLLAENHYKMAIKTGGSLHCFNTLTTFYVSRKLPQKAISNIENTLEKYPHNILHYQIGEIAANHKTDLQKGARNLNVYLKKDTENHQKTKAFAYYYLAQINTYNNNKPEALKHINLALAKSPQNDMFKKQKEQILKL